MIKFVQLGHEYSSLDPEKQIDWIGITSLCEAFKPPFKSKEMSIKVSKNPRSKWYKMEPEAIRKAWKGESTRSLDAGTWYHNKEEAVLTKDPIYEELTVIKPLIVGGDKYAPSQALLENHIYPEHMVYLFSDGVCGQSDRVEVVNGRVNVRDYKTCKAIKQEGFTNWEGISARMMDPLTHLDDCNFIHYSLQLSLYLYIILKHNPHLKPGKLTLDHIVFEMESEDEFGYPIYKRDSEGGFLIQEVIPYDVTYLRSEVAQILDFLKTDRELIKNRIKEKKEDR